MNKHPFRRRALALLLSLVCVLGLLQPANVFAADDSIPNEITLKEADYPTGASANGLETYQAPNGLDEVTIHNFRVDVGGKEVTGFCGDHRKLMGTRWEAEKWENPGSVDTNLDPLLAYYYWACENEESFEGGASGWANQVTNTYIQCVIWLAKAHRLPDYRTDRAGWIAAVAEQREAAYDHYHAPNPSEWSHEFDAEFRLEQYESGVFGTNWQFLEYNYTGENGDPQPIIIGLREPHADYYVIKKVDTAGNNISGVTFRVESEDGSFSTTVTTNVSGIAQFNSTAGDGWYTFTETAAPSGYVRNTTPVRVYLTADVPGEIQFVNTGTTKKSLEIRKVDIDDPTKGIAGAVIKLTHPASGRTSTFTSGADGWVVIPQAFVDEMLTGLWEAEEITPPAGYRLNPDPNITKQTFIWDGGRTPVSLIFTNDSDAKIRFRKVDADNPTKGLPGAVVAVYKDGVPITIDTTDEQGYITINGADEGFWVFEELTPPPGYARDIAPYVGVHIDPAQIAGNEPIEVTMVNHKTPTLRIRKVDAASGDPIPGTVFEVKGVNNTFATTVTTGADGWAVLENVDAAVYEVTELSVPAPYILDTNNRQTVALLAGKDHSLTFANSKEPGLRIIKKDAETGKPVAGVTFKIEKIDGSYSVELTTDDKGEIFCEHLAAGAYRVQEIAVPGNYILDDTVKTATLEPNKTTTLEFRNHQRPGLLIQKVTSDGKKLEGVRFNVKVKDGSSIGDFTTDTKGEIFIPDLNPGWYTITETYVPKGYILDSTPHDVLLQAGASGDGKAYQTYTLVNHVAPKLTIYKVDSVTHGSVEGAKIQIIFAGENRNGSVRDLGVHVSDHNGEIKLENLEIGWYRIKEIEAPDGYQLKSEEKLIYLDADGEGTVTFENTPLNAIIVLKKDSVSGKPVAGCTFQLRYLGGTSGTGGTVIDTQTTSTTGTITWTRLKAGTYIIEELNAADGYVIGKSVKTVYLSGEQQDTVVVTFDNAPKGSLLIKKVCSINTSKMLAGARFEVKYADGSYVGNSNGVYVTDANGEILITDLEPNKSVVVTETKAPDGFVLDTTPQTIEAKAGQVVTLTFANAPDGRLIIEKRDSKTNRLLPGAEFRVSTAAGCEVGQNGVIGTATVTSAGLFRTDAEGKITITNLRPGTYNITEVNAPEGYMIDDPTRTVTITAGDTQAVVFKDTPKGALTIHKYVTGTQNEPLKGVEFKVVDGSGKAVGSSNGVFYTDAQGNITIPNLEAGMTLTVRETKALEGYVLDGTPQTITISGGGENNELTFWNAPQGVLIVKKLDSITKEPLAGAEFKITYDSGAFVDNANGHISSNGVYKTDANGEIRIAGLTGTVVVEETKAPDGYILDPNSAKQTVKVNAADTQTLTFFNTPKQTLTIHKYVDGTQNKPLKGVEFKVTDGSGRAVGSSNGVFYTDAQGNITIPNLEAGMTLTVRETKTLEGYVLDGTPQTITISGGGENNELTFWNAPQGVLIVKKLDSITKEPLAGAEFKITYDRGAFVDNANGHISSNGVYTTDVNGEIRIAGLTGTVVVEETKAPDGYILDPNGAKQTVKVNAADTQTLTFYNTPIGGLTIYKVDADSGKRLSGAKIEVRRMNGAIVGTYVSDRNGVIQLPQLDDGWYELTELKAPDGYLLDATPQKVEVRQGKTTVFEFENIASASMLIHKVCSVTGAGLQGAKFVLYDRSMTPIGEYESDNNGYVHLSRTLKDGRYYVREIVAPEGYILDNNTKSFYVTSGETAMIEWENTPQLAQIQIVKTSADYNSTNGLPAGTPLADAIYTVYDKRNNIVDTIKTNASGVASTKLLPLGFYHVKETTAPAKYGIDTATYDVELEFVGQVYRLNLTNKSVSARVAIRKSGPQMVVNGQNLMMYRVSSVRNDSTVALQSFYWRDTLPTDAFRLTKITTGTYSSTQSYKVTYTTNYDSTWRTAYDNLTTAKNYTLDMSATALGLRGGEYVTEVMLSFGIVPAGFHQLTEAAVYGSVLRELVNGYQFTNKADVGGLLGGHWEQGIARWTTTVKSTWTPPALPKLPRTGY